jgi:predicted aminopeptidase
MIDYELEKQREKTEQKKFQRSAVKWSVIGSLVILITVVLSMIGCPKYRVYQQTKEGEAKLAEAQSSRQIAVSEAKAKLESASLLAQADTIRAHGVARSNQIIGASLKDNQAYLHWLWIDNIEKNPNAVIYIPTEANLPILEAGHTNRVPITPQP